MPGRGVACSGGGVHGPRGWGAWSQGGGALPQGVHGLGVHGPGGGCMVPGRGAWSQGVHGPGGLVSQHALMQTPPGETATAADGMHPTGMHSCF